MSLEANTFNYIGARFDSKGQVIKKYDSVLSLKYCPGCKIVKSFLEFHKDCSAHSGYSARCKSCIKLRTQKYKLQRLVAGTNSIHHKRNDLRKMYGITLEQFNLMVKTQNNKCAICFGPPNGKGKNLHVDHCHRTGKIRGLLCHSCNVSLGALKENVRTLKNMIKYLREVPNRL